MTESPADLGGHACPVGRANAEIRVCVRQLPPRSADWSPLQRARYEQLVNAYLDAIGTRDRAPRAAREDADEPERTAA